ncbi:MAG TPA: hypothetical protein DCL54_16155 [Alphaproteobacteria bacterium]|nr:hypothetical protein [Alphaproteobacteria bacterium]HAJ48106.1 hypothetical protein [Alphaproteobacteria bacterium]
MADAQLRSPLWLVALLGRCPRCGTGGVFAGFLKIKPACSTCGLDLTRADSGDGPAVFVVLIVGAITAFTALWLELTFKPPYWVHAAVLGPMVLGLSLLLLRPLKALMIALQYRHQAGEGRQE